MIRIIKSHSLTTLAEKLSGILDSNAPANPLQAQQILVPNLDTSRWLMMYHAKTNGIAANIEFVLPSEWQWNQVRKYYSELPKLLPSDPDPMKWVLYDILLNIENRQKFPFLDRYITSQGSEFEKERTLQLAGQIAWLFDQYQVYRPDMIVAWQNGRIGSGDEKWQSGLWRLFDEKIKKSTEGEARYNRAELFLNIIQQVREENIEFNRSLFVFNPGLIPKTIIDLMKQAGKQQDLYIFLSQPSECIDQPQNKLLQSFGDESDRISTLFDVGGAEIHSEFPKMTGESDLKNIQKSIIANKPISLKNLSDKFLDGIEIRSCHSPVREIETLHQFLIQQFENDENLHPDDVLVVTPNLDEYRPAIHAVFGTGEDGLPDIPYHCDNRSQGGYDLHRAFLHLFDLMDSRFTFADVMDLFAMKSVQEKFSVAEADTGLIRNWMEENHVVWGLGADHRKEWNQPAEKLQTWQEALKRGWLGQWIDNGEDRILGDTLLFGDLNSTSKRKLWAAFSSYLNRLDDMRKKSKISRSCSAWCDLTEKWMDRIFAEKALSDREGITLKRALESVRESSKIVQFDGEIGFSEFRSEITSKIKDQHAGTANFNRGVVFSSMVPVRSIPAKIIALIGLNEETFPRKPSVPEFDLMAQNPALQDRNRKEEDRNLFLESIMVASEIHYCSYIGQSSVDNETIPPSPIVGEWIDLLAAYSGLKVNQIVKQEPLTGFSIFGFQSGKNYSRVYYNTARSILKEAGKISGLNIANLPPPEEDNEYLQVDELVRFFGNPLQWFLKNRFDVRLYKPDSEKDEFQIDNLDKHILFQRVFGWTFSGVPEQKMESLLVQSGALPMGWPGRRELNSMLSNVKSSLSRMEEAGFKSSLIQHKISISLNNILIEGLIKSYSENEFVDISPSGMSGKLAVQGWLRHLCLSCCTDEKHTSYLLCDLKKGDSKLYQFTPVENPVDQLKNFVEIFETGRSTPPKFFPKTLYTYVEEELKGNPKAANKASVEFEGNEYNQFSEGRNEYITALMGENASFQEDFLDQTYTNLIEKMQAHIEEVK